LHFISELVSITSSSNQGGNSKHTIVSEDGFFDENSDLFGEGGNREQVSLLESEVSPHLPSVKAQVFNGIESAVLHGELNLPSGSSIGGSLNFTLSGSQVPENR